MYIYVRYIMDSHHTNKDLGRRSTRNQFSNMTDGQIQQHIVMERGGNILRCYMKKDKATKTANAGVLHNYKG